MYKLYINIAHFLETHCDLEHFKIEESQICQG